MKIKISLLVFAKLFITETFCFDFNNILETQMILTSTFARDRYLNSNLFALQGSILYITPIKNKFLLNINANIISSTGYFSAGLTNDFSPKNKIEIIESTLLLPVTKSVNFRIGAIDQNKKSAILKNEPFLAIEENFIFKNKNITSKISLEQAIISWENKENHFYNSTKVPICLFEKIELQNNSNTYNLDFFHIYFNNLSSEIAHESNFLGNSISGITKNTASFDYRFNTFGTSNKLINIFRGSIIRFSPQITLLKNSSAPQSRNLGIIGSFQIDYSVIDKNKINFLFDVFWIESDVLPATYINKAYGYSNSKGLRFESEIMLDELTSVFFNISVSKTIRENNFKNNFRYLNFGLKRLL